MEIPEKISRLVVNPAQTEEQEQDRHSEDMQEIITRVPSWIVRWGITIFFGILLMAVAISILIRYPDTLNAGIKIETTNGPVTISAIYAGKLSRVLVASGANVKKGQALAYIQSDEKPGSEYALIAPQDGKVSFLTIVEPGCFFKANQAVFTINPLNPVFFGLVEIPQNSISKIKVGQSVLISLNSFPSEEYGLLNGTVTFVADEPNKNGLFTLKISIKTNKLSGHPIELKSWMAGEARIITEDVSLEKRIYKSIVKGIK